MGMRREASWRMAFADKIGTAGMFPTFVKLSLTK
jgi:hypothetical protein